MKYRLFIVMLLAAVLSGCYDDYRIDTIGFTDVYFMKNEQVRSVVAGEGLSIKIGVNLGGISENKEDRIVNFILDETLLGTSYTILPADYYTLSNPSELIIPKGKFIGFIDIQFDSLKMAADTMLRGPNYALPFRIVSTSADSILGGKDHMVVPIKIMNTYEGNYYTVGYNIVFDSSGSDTAEVYGDPLDGTKTPIRALSSVMMDSVIVDGVANRGGDGYGMKLRVNPGNNSVEILPLAGSLYQVEQNGASTWDPVKRVLLLKYKYQDAGKRYEVEEQLTFRNRIRDGIDEWRWKGFDGN